MTGRLPLLSFAAALVVAWFGYAASFGADFQLDDEPNLGGLANVSDARSAVDFVLGGTAGPTGRPLALLSFVPQAEAWQDGPDAFLRVNILIHLLNAVLLLLCVRRLFRIRGAAAGQATGIAAISATVWVLLPLIATATLLVVQRMTTLSATFLLFGLLAYLASRSLLARSPRTGLLLMSASLVLGSVMAALAKESGALLPVLVLTIESTLLARPDRVDRRTWNAWATILLWLPFMAALAYLASRLPYPDHVVLHRGFDADERLLTEAQLLWVYLGKALVGLPGRLGIFQDIQVVQSAWSGLLAAAAWGAVLVAAALARRRVPLAAFAVLWYLAGHLLESTVLPLELYFEHRNYLPIIGPIVALVAGTWQLAGRARVLALGVLAAFVVGNALSLYTFASLQGDPSVAARFWAVKYPDSPRAVANLAAYQMSEESVDKAIGTLRDFVGRNPRYAYLRIQELNLTCLVAPQRLDDRIVDEVASQLRATDLSFVASEMLLQLFETVSTTDCKPVDVGTVVELAEALLANPRYAANPRYNQIHHMLMATVRRDIGDAGAALAHLDRARDFGPSIDVIRMTAITLAVDGDAAAARAFLDEASASAPLNPLKALRWRRIFGGLYDYVDAMEQEQNGKS